MVFIDLAPFIDFLIIILLLFFHSGKNLKEKLLSLEEDLLKLTDDLQQEAQCLPNLTHPDVPIGGEDCSTIRKKVFLFLSKVSCFPCLFCLLSNYKCGLLGW